MITNEIREDIRQAVANAWHFCASWVEQVADVLAEHGVTWDLEADKIINQIAFQTLEELSNKDDIK
tara:strand:- start:78 stop:275 length:198 start_codon:yes stop_codon:yes gene_type:complete